LQNRSISQIEKEIGAPEPGAPILFLLAGLFVIQEFFDVIEGAFQGFPAG
jgi:hypothetical protein